MYVNILPAKPNQTSKMLLWMLMLLQRPHQTSVEETILCNTRHSNLQCLSGGLQVLVCLLFSFFFLSWTMVNPFNHSHLELAASLSRKCVCRQFDFQCLETAKLVFLSASTGFKDLIWTQKGNEKFLSCFLNFFFSWLKPTKRHGGGILCREGVQWRRTCPQA